MKAKLVMPEVYDLLRSVHRTGSHVYPLNRSPLPKRQSRLCLSQTLYPDLLTFSPGISPKLPLWFFPIFFLSENLFNQLEGRVGFVSANCHGFQPQLDALELGKDFVKAFAYDHKRRRRPLVGKPIWLPLANYSTATEMLGDSGT